MDFKLSDQQRELQETARNFAQKEMVDVAQSMEQTSEPLSKEWLKRYSEMGFLGINVSEKYGGLGLSNLDALLVMEEFAKISSAVAFPILRADPVTIATLPTRDSLLSWVMKRSFYSFACKLCRAFIRKCSDSFIEVLCYCTVDEGFSLSI